MQSKPQLSARDRFMNRGTEQKLVPKDTLVKEVPKKPTSARDRFLSRDLDLELIVENKVESPIPIPTITPSFNMSFETEEPSVSNNLYTVRKIPTKTKTKNFPVIPATTPESLQLMLESSSINIMAEYKGCNYNKYILKIDPKLGKCIIDYTDTICEKMKLQYKGSKTSYVVDLKDHSIIRVKKIPVSELTYIPDNVYEFKFTLSKPWHFENYIGISLNI